MFVSPLVYEEINMRTVVIYETSDETCLYVVDGDLTRFEGIFVNSMESDETLLVHCGFIY